MNMCLWLGLCVVVHAIVSPLTHYVFVCYFAFAKLITLDLECMRSQMNLSLYTVAFYYTLRFDDIQSYHEIACKHAPSMAIQYCDLDITDMVFAVRNGFGQIQRCSTI